MANKTATSKSAAPGKSATSSKSSAPKATSVKAAGSKSAPKPAAKSTKEKKKANKSALIKSILTDDPKTSPKTIAEELHKQGLEVTPGYVSTIKSNFLKKAGLSRSRNGGDDVVSMAQLKQLMQVVENIGGVERTRQLLGILNDLK